MILDFFQSHFSDGAKLAAVWLLAVSVLSVLYAVVSRRIDTIRHRMHGGIPSKRNLLLWDFLCWSSVLSLVGLTYYAARGVSDPYAKNIFFLAMFFTLVLFFVFVTKKFFGSTRQKQRFQEIF